MNDAYLITRMVEKFHVQPRPLNDEFSKNIFTQLFKELDPDKIFFTKEDINTLARFKSSLDEDAGKVNSYVDNVYLIFFKCYWQDGEIVKAMNKGKFTEMEQGRTSLIRFADEGLATLETLKAFAGDVSLANTCKKVLQFYKKMGEQDLPKQTDYYLKTENFDKMKKSFESKSKSDRTKEDVAAFNKSVDEINQASDSYNAVNKSINETRSYLLDNWNEAEKNFTDSHMPYYK